MHKVNIHALREMIWFSPKGKFQSASREVSEALGWNPESPSARGRHPFAVEILRIPAGQTPYPYHAHAAQWEYYQVLSGSGQVRDAEGRHAVGAGDAFIFGPGEAHQLTAGDAGDFVLCVVADNPIGESVFYPDSGKWLVRSPERRLFRGANLDYYDGEE